MFKRLFRIIGDLKGSNGIERNLMRFKRIFKDIKVFKGTLRGLNDFLEILKDFKGSNRLSGLKRILREFRRF